MKTRRQIVVPVVMIALSLMLGACGDSDNNPVVAAGNGSGGGAPTKTFVIAADDNQGNLTFFESTGEAPATTSPEIGKVNFGTLGLGEIHFAHGKALMVVSSGLVGPAKGLASGGLAVVDVATQNVDKIVTLESTQTGNESRMVHAYLDPEEKYLWMNNDGPRGDGADDSVFRVNIDPADPEYLTVAEMITGNGHHKSAFPRASADQPKVKKLFVTSNLSATSLNVIDEATLQVVKTVKNVGFVPHGMDYSPVSGHVYSGITGGGVAIIDATSPDVDDPTKSIFDFFAPNPLDSSVTKIDKTVIKAAGYVHAAQDGKVVYTAGWREIKDAADTVIGGEGFLYAIDAENNDAVIAEIPIGNVAMSSFDESTSAKKIYIPSRTRSGSPGANPKTDVVVVVDIDPASATYHTVLTEITIGEAGSHRNGEVTEDGSLAIYPDTCDTCNTISVIDTETDTVIDVLVVDGKDPRVNVLKTQ